MGKHTMNHPGVRARGKTAISTTRGVTNRRDPGVPVGAIKMKPHELPMFVRGNGEKAERGQRGSEAAGSHKVVSRVRSLVL